MFDDSGELIRYKASNSPEHLASLKAIKIEFRQKSAIAKDLYFFNLGERLVRDTKEFWRYVKRNGKDNRSIPALKNDETIIHDNESKVEIFSRYFSSVFLPSSSCTICFELPIEIDRMPEVTFCVDGIRM